MPTPRETQPTGELTGREPAEVALPILIERHAEQIFALGLRFCRNPDDARDLVQETFLLAFRKWHQFQGRARASTWLYTIASRVCQRRHRGKQGRAARMQSLDELLPFGETGVAVQGEADPHSLEGREEQAARLAAVERAIAELPLSSRLPLVLKDLAGLPLADISAALGLQVETVKTRLHRARLAVRKQIESGRPRRDAPAPIFSRQVCLDLLAAKQEALDRGAQFEFPDGVVCERCATVFAGLDLAQEACQEIGKRGEMPAALKQLVLQHVAEETRRAAGSRRKSAAGTSGTGTRGAEQAPRRARKARRA